MKTMVVAGHFGEKAKESGLIKKMFEDYPDKVDIWNGGKFEKIPELLALTSKYDVVFWFADVSNEYEKLRNVKEYNPNCILVSSKRNDGDKYCFEELISRSLEVKANLTMQFCKSNDVFNISVFDPLGTMWCAPTTDYKEVMSKTYNRLTRLVMFHRKRCFLSDERLFFGVEPQFLDIIHKNAEVFHQLIQPPEVVKRFLGNASFRCVHGFPSFRGNDCIVVSRRNVDKAGITDADFVPVRLKDGQLYAFSENKPSVDTPIQVTLYDCFPKINYMLHSHVYIKNAPFTQNAIPCGALEEVSEVLDAVDEYKIDSKKDFCLNLKGHGSLFFAKTLDYFDKIEYVSRPIPEFIKE